MLAPLHGFLIETAFLSPVACSTGTNAVHPSVRRGTKAMASMAGSTTMVQSARGLASRLWLVGVAFHRTCRLQEKRVEIGECDGCESEVTQGVFHEKNSATCHPRSDFVPK